MAVYDSRFHLGVITVQYAPAWTRTASSCNGSISLCPAIAAMAGEKPALKMSGYRVEPSFPTRTPLFYGTRTAHSKAVPAEPSQTRINRSAAARCRTPSGQARRVGVIFGHTSPFPQARIARRANTGVRAWRLTQRGDAERSAKEYNAFETRPAAQSSYSRVCVSSSPSTSTARPTTRCSQHWFSLSCRRLRPR